MKRIMDFHTGLYSFSGGNTGEDLVGDCRIGEISIFDNMVLKFLDILY